MTTADPRLFAALQRAVAGRYSLERQVGAGGMGVVFLARDVQLGRAVAIKLMRAELAGSPTARDRFLAEARLAAGLAHPNIVPIHEVAEQGQLMWYVMAFVHGRSLGDLVRTRGPLLPAEMGRIIREVAWALSYAHGRGIVHRDIKPDNIFIEDGGRVLVLDFGIAQRTGDAAEAIGTIGFLPPEQRRPGPPDPRSDLYALAVTAAAVLRGKVPADPRTAAAWITADAPWAGPLLGSCLAEEVTERPASARLVAEQLRPPTPQPIHPDVRRWIGEARPLRSIGWGWTVFLGLLMYSTAGRVSFTLETALLSILIVWPVTWLIRLWQTRRVLSQGHSATDLREGLGRAVTLRRQELLARRSARATSPGLVSIQIGIAFALLPFYIHYIDHAPWGFVAGMFEFAIFFVLVGVILTGLRVGADQKRDAVLERRARLWTGTFGGWLMRLASLGLSRTDRISGGPAGLRPTETLLAHAIRTSAEALPGEWASQTAAIESAAEKLERAAEGLGDRCLHLEAELRAGVGKREATQMALADARARREEALTALDAIRRALDAFGTGTGDVRALTGAVDDALEIAERVQHLAEARQELEEFL